MASYDERELSKPPRLMTPNTTIRMVDSKSSHNGAPDTNQ